MGNRDDEPTKVHDAGQSDASKGQNNPPHSIGAWDRMIYPDYAIKNMERENDAYNKGQDNARKDK